MIEFEIAIRIDQPLEEVYSFVADLENLPKWNYYVVRVTKTSAGAAGAGSTYHQVRKTDEQDLRITIYDQNRTLVVETVPPSKPELKRSMSFQEEGSATRIIDRWKLDTGHPGFIQRLAAGRVKSAVEENLGKLKQLLESGRVTLQDGRTISL